MKANWKQVLLSVFAAALATLPFIRTLNFPFLDGWDDSFIVENSQYLDISVTNILHWSDGSNYASQRIPATFISFMFDKACGGGAMNPRIVHAQNILWHMLATAGLFMCFTLFKVRPWLAFAMALVYAVHPQKAESVAWIAERKDVLFGAFAIWSFYFYAKIPQERKFAPLPLALFIVSILSKPTAIALPAVFMAYELSRPKPFKIKETAIRLAPFIAVTSILSLTSCAVSSGYQKSLAMKLLTIAHNQLWHLESFLLPWNLLPIYPSVSLNAGTVIFCLVGYLLLGALAVLLYIKTKDFFLWKAIPLGLCFLFAIGPTSGLIQIAGIDYADRYNYVPSAFLCFAVAWLLSRLLDWTEDKLPEKAKNIAFVAIAGVLSWIIFLSAICVNGVETYSSPIALFTVASMPEKPSLLGVCLLAKAKFKKGEPAVAELYEKLQSSGHTPENAKFEFIFAEILAAAEAMQRNPANAKQAIAVIEKYALMKMPENFMLTKLEILNILMNCQFMDQRKEDGLKTLGEIIERSKSPQMADEDNHCLQFYLGLKFIIYENYSAAEKHFKRAFEISPTSETYRQSYLRAKNSNKSAN